MNEPDLALLVPFYVVLIGSMVAHEAAHAWAARRGGDPTAYHEGSLTLDPRPHIRREPMGTVVVPLLSFVSFGWMIGWASAPYDPAWAWRHPRRAGLMAAAGPAANLVVLIMTFWLIRLGLSLGWFEAPNQIAFTDLLDADGGLAQVVATLLSLAFIVNLLLFVFNLLPVPPLDGATAIGAALPDEMTRRWMVATRSPAVALGGLLVGWWVLGRYFGDVYLWAVNLLFPDATYR